MVNRAIHLGMSSGATAPTFNPSDKNVNITLSPDNLTATLGGGGGAFSNIRATAGASSGKKFFKVTIAALTPVSGTMIGIANGTALLSNYVGSDLNGYSYADDNGIYLNAANPHSMGSGFVTTDVISVAADYTNHLIWFQKNAGLWNNSGVGDPTNPATGAGFDISGMNAGPYFPAITLFTAGDSFTADFSGAGAPSGFSGY